MAAKAWSQECVGGEEGREGGGEGRMGRRCIAASDGRRWRHLCRFRFFAFNIPPPSLPPSLPPCLYSPKYFKKVRLSPSAAMKMLIHVITCPFLCSVSNLHSPSPLLPPSLSWHTAPSISRRCACPPRRR